MRAAIVGASGYAGSELLRLLSAHPEIEIVAAVADSAAGQLVAEHTPALAGEYPTLRLTEYSSASTVDADLVFCALPHGESQKLVPSLVAQGRLVVDLGADFRFRDPESYAKWYQQRHAAPAMLADAVYALVERHRVELKGATLLAVPGCYPTAVALALGPFVDARWVAAEGTVVNALSGTSGAGRALNERLHFSRMHDGAEAYGLLDHRHTGEMQQELGVELLFTPHLVPVSRGLLVTAYARTTQNHTTDDALALLRRTYADDPFVVVTDEPPNIKDALGSNVCFVTARVDPRTGWLVALSSLDNLVKGAAGQALQAFNVSQEWPETWGLSRSGMTP